MAIIYYDANPQVIEWLCQKIQVDKKVLQNATLIYQKTKNKIISATSFSIHENKLFVSIASENNTLWANKKYLTSLFAYVFIQLNLKEVFCKVLFDNHPSINLVQRLGFKKIGQQTIDGKDFLIFRVEKKGCKWLTHIGDLSDYI